ncbi:nitrilase and fragile histidine triad fusion protein NitFhit [Anopheles ziemanni]|uniref:nitrilase and fragile histidine triad fusion protein NitFhit n=1 Tax=Anopheles ziemanni TaxID=345580 RepID=UPI0026586A3D|nr:nitrilase and fragile histidine triad fusion protein NitFhit isoform X2 [Anopheles coustani]XP_058172643.1 nitrilase and fragile histidine triad fusion protein NitFhit [Anopheles ziemanni]
MTSLLIRLRVQSVCAPSRSITSYVRTMASQSGKAPRIAVAQMRATNDKQHNLAQVQAITEQSKAKDVQFIFFPECCDYVGTHREETLKLSEPLTGPTVEAYKKLARDNDVWMSFGGVHESIIEESTETDGQVKNIYNTHILINNAGKLVASYRKLHMFNVVTPEFKFRESETVRSGPALVAPVETPIGRIGLQICYDMRFAEASTILRKLGADILTYPSAFAVSTGRAHWEVLLRARAIENQCFVVAAAQIGFHNKKRESYGHAMVVNPWGEILGEAGNQDLDVVVAELNYAKLESVRANMPCFDHRRDDVYSLSARQDMAFVSGSIPPDTIFYVSEHCFAFTNIRCVVPGHVLVSIKRPAHRLPDLTPAERNDFFQTVCKVQKVAERLYNASSSTVTVQDGPEAGQTVCHVHCHVMPRHLGDFPENDQIYIELNRHDKEPERPRRSIEEMAAEAKRFRDEFSR